MDNWPRYTQNPIYQFHPPLKNNTRPPLQRTGRETRNFLRPPVRVGQPVQHLWGICVVYGHWIGLREKLNWKPWFLPLNMGVSCK